MINKAAAQQDTIALPSVQVLAHKMIKHSVKKNFLYPNYWLEQQDISIQIKSYGGVMTTLSLRSFKSSHTKIIMFETPLTMGGSGIYDVFLLPIELFPSLQIQTSQQNISKISGALGGTIELNYEDAKSYNNHITTALSNTGGIYTKNHFKFSNKYINTSFASIETFCSNHYKFFNQFTNSTQTQHNAWYNKNHILWSSKLKFANNLFYIHFLKSDILRSFPQPMTYQGAQRKETEHFRQQFSSITYSRKFHSFQLNLLLSYTNQSSVYNLKTKDNKWLDIINTQWLLNTLFYKLNLSCNLAHFSLSIKKDSYLLTTIEPQQISLSKSRNYFSFVAVPKNISLGKLKFSTVQKIDIVNNKHNYLFDYQASTQTQPRITLSYSKNLNYPSLNDLYWLPGGNSKLLAERSQEWNITTNYHIEIKHLHIFLKAQAFRALVKNWILWKPTQYHYWTAQNIPYVTNTTGSIRLKLFIKNKTFENLVLSYQFSSVKDSTGIQIIYVPRHRLLNKISFRLYGINIAISALHESKKLILMYNSDFCLKTYTLFFLSLEKTINTQYFILSTELSINNLTNTHYMLVVNRPEPLRNFIFSVQINLKP